MLRIFIAAACLAASTPAAAQAPPSAPAAPATPVAWQVPDDAAIRAILAHRIDDEGRGVGIVVGVIDARGRRVVAYGRKSVEGPAATPDADTVFEIGSMTKVFTSLLLADMVRRGEVRLDEPVEDLLPPGAKAPERAGRKITLVDLATHTSGLPRMPANFRPADPENPYADYTADKLFEFISGYELPRDIGAKYEYSNLGAAFLGQLLARRAGVDYETLVRRRLLSPLGLSDTAITLSPSLRSRLAPGHGPLRYPTANWDLPAFAGAGALRSTTNDMLSFLAAELGFRRTPLAAAMADQLAARRPTGDPAMQVALGWHIRTLQGREIVWHNGGTGGYRTFMGFDPAEKVGVVVLTNTSIEPGGDDIGFHLLTGAPLAKLPPGPAAHRIIAAAAEDLAPFVGTYDFGPNRQLVVTQTGPRLFGTISGQQRLELFREGPNDFFVKVVDAQITFERGPDGQVARAIVHQAGQDTPGVRAKP
jgi:CubicO group peptidase (beta-lactamase class C family)